MPEVRISIGGREFDVADKLRFRLAFGGQAFARDAIDADVDDQRARLDPVALDHLGLADGGDEHVGATDDFGQIAGARMGDGDGAAFAQQQLRHGLADQDRAPDHHGILAG